MAEDEKDRRLDTMLDSLLSGYSQADPRPGLELRIRATLRSHAAQRRWFWMLASAGVAAMLALVMVTSQLRPSRPNAPVHVVAAVATPGSGVVPLHPAMHPSRTSRPTGLADPGSSVHTDPPNRILLQVANTMEPADNPIFERERLYLTPAPPQPESAPEPPTSAPSLTIEDLGVQSLEIKELPSSKSTDSKGDL